VVPTTWNPATWKTWRGSVEGDGLARAGHPYDQLHGTPGGDHGVDHGPLSVGEGLSAQRRLRQVERQYGDKLDEVADFLAEFAAKVKAVGPKTYLESMAYNERDAKRDRQKDLDELSLDRRA
jgi:hypothetical protein